MTIRLSARNETVLRPGSEDARYGARTLQDRTPASWTVTLG